MRRPLLFLLIAAALGVCSALIHERSPQERLTTAAAELQRRIDQASLRLLARAQHALDTDTVPMDEGHAPGEGGLRLYTDSIVTAWTDHAPITDAALDTARAAHLTLPDGTYLHAFVSQGHRSVHAVQRLWFKPPFENQYLRNQFDAGFTLTTGVIAEQGPGLGPVVRDADGNVMLRLQWTDDMAMPGARSLLSLLFALAGIICAVVALWLAAMALHRAWVSSLLFVTVLLGARIATLAHGTFDALANYPLFDPSLFASSFFMPSLGDLLINTAVLLCVALFLHRALHRARTPVRPWPLVIGAAAVLFFCAGGIGSVMIALVHDSSVSLDLFRVQGFDGYSLAALIAIGVLLFAWCVLADAAVRLLSPTLPGPQKLGLIVLACAVLVAINHYAGNYDLMLALWPLPVLWLLDRMRRRPGTIPALLLIATLALITAHVLNRQTFKRIQLDRETLAETATTREDPVIELLFDEAKREMEKDVTLLTWVRSGTPCSSSDLDRLVRQPFFTGYWDRYDLRLHLIPEKGPYCSTSPDAASSAQLIADRFEQGVPAGKHNDLRITDRPGEDALYMGHLWLDSTQLFVELRPRLVADGLGFPELLLAGQRPSPFKPGRFVRARYERGVLTSSSGPFVFPISWKRPTPPDGLHWIDNGYDLLAQGDPHGALLVLGTRIPSWWDHVTTFSYLFLFFCLLAAMVGGIGLLFSKDRTVTMGISGKVRLGVAGFAIVSLLIFTFGMRRMLDVRQEQRSSRTLDERSRGVLAELRQTLRGEGVLAPSMTPYLDHLLGNLSNVFFTDLTLYDPKGVLFATSREQVFNTGLLGRRMDPRAYQRLAVEGASSFIHGEHIGTATFSTAYMPFRNDQGEVLAYLALPYFARQGEVEQERAAGFVALVNLFTLLFLLSVVAAALITHWTTRPLELLRRGLERIGLGARNEPINYRGNDELGQLVSVYNRKVDELRESAMKLARSERESAWREMAKQVAHEIKNPLTPMKLNIQQFQRTWSPELPDAKARLDRFSDGLVQQIEALSRIAGEFSDFAQMPRARPEQVDLSEAAAAATALFAADPSAEVVLHPGPSLLVSADREHLQRAFTNLIKNALQAMPEGRSGRVEVMLSKEGSSAVVEVRDNGTGIALADRERIFQPSFTTKSSGMGLGLAIVQRMVENAGGSVRFETSTTPGGTGTSFFVELPLVVN
ncbi:MAG: ATP-binding protein [Flavobacteriales bacterium]